MHTFPWSVDKILYEDVGGSLARSPGRAMPGYSSKVRSSNEAEAWPTKERAREPSFPIIAVESISWSTANGCRRRREHEQGHGARVQGRGEMASFLMTMMAF